MTRKPVTRFAPSPTGYLHIGGARTALFNWLYAKAKGGTFLLRIEDTDRARSTPDAIRAIIDGLAWIGIDWSGEPVFQFARADRHREVASQLLAQGRAYHCYLTPEELETMRTRAEAEKRPPRIDSPWRDRDPKEAPAGVKPALRLKAPREGETVIEDCVQGRVAFPNKDLEDLVILRSDGTPTYNLAVVVDDHDMGITHVIRGVEHLSNAPKQSQIYDAMGWPRPTFAHVPLIHDAAGKKLSKRHGAAGVEEYRAMGYLPAALRNYLVRLGWSHGDDEIFSTDDLVRWFDIDGIGQSPARFDFAKLDNLNGHYIRQTPDAELMAHIRGAYRDMIAAKPDLPRIETDADWHKLADALPGLKERAKTLVEIVSGAAYLYRKRPLALDDGAKKHLTPAVIGQLRHLAARLAGLDDWTAAALEAAVRTFAEEAGLKLGKIAQPLRAALTGSTVSPPIFDVMAVLGRDESLARLMDQTRT